MRFPTLPGFFVCAFCLGRAATLGADGGGADEVAGQWRGVRRVRGTASIEFRSGRNDGDEHSHFTVERSTRVQIDFSMERKRVAQSSGRDLSWHAVSATITGATFGTVDQDYPWHQVHFTTRADFSGRPRSLADFSLVLKTDTGVWQLVSPSHLQDKYRETTSGTDHNPSTNETRVIHEEEEIDRVDAGVIFDGKVAGSPGLVSGTAKLASHGTRDNPTGWSSTIGQLQFWPEFDNLEVEVTIEGYAQWRPKGSIADLTKPGNGLVARAVLQSKDGKNKDLPEVDRFRFELIETSREPGVCLNWPLGAKDDDFDLRLADFKSGSGPDPLAAMRKFVADWGMRSMGDYDLASIPDGAIPRWSFPEVDDDGQKGELPEPPKDKDGHPFAEVAIESFDFGAKAELRVTCILKDGRELIGLMKGEDGKEELVRLPKRNGPDWVAESWRKENQAENLADSDDNESVEGQKNNGDGFTLYEEYRGWVEKGRHIEGDPKGKDLFVLNLIDADARGGIALFARLSKLRVHSRLRDGKEMSQEERLMNGNHRAAPHRVDQHGVVISHEAGGAGGYNVGVEGVDKTKAGRPRNIRFVYVETHHPDGLFSATTSAEYYLSERDAQSAYDRGVAHELLHAVGVDHHGEILWSYVKCYFQGAAAPLNPTHRARFTTDFGLSTFQTETLKDWHGDRGATITLLWEDTQRDVVEDSLAAYEAELAKHRADFRTESYINDTAATAVRMSGLGVNHDAAFWAEYGADNLSASDFNRVIRVGKLGGTDSGNELCVLRYYFANAYRIAGRENAYYLIRPGAGANRAGRELCMSPEGTGTNAKSHQPQSRFGDAYSGRGDCFGDICPNDAIPPRSVILR